MKMLRTLLFTICFAAGFSAFAQNTITSTEAHITITGATSRQDLATLRSDLLAQGIDFRYTPNFDAERNLISLDFTVTANDGAVSGSAMNMNMKNPNATIVFHINKTNNTCTSKVLVLL
jgi:hypothetical protein